MGFFFISPTSLFRLYVYFPSPGRMINARVGKAPPELGLELMIFDYPGFWPHVMVTYYPGQSACPQGLLSAVSNIIIGSVQSCSGKFGVKSNGTSTLPCGTLALTYLF